MNEPTLADMNAKLDGILHEVQGLRGEVGGLREEVRDLREDVKTLDAVQRKRFREFRKEVSALTFPELQKQVEALREDLEAISSTQNILIAALQGNSGAKEDVRNMHVDL